MKHFPLFLSFVSIIPVNYEDLLDGFSLALDPYSIKTEIADTPEHFAVLQLHFCM